MSTEKKELAPHRPSLLRNWTSLVGLVVSVGALFSFFLLFMLDALSKSANPYVGILTFCVVPAFLISGIGLTFFGAWRERRKRQHSGQSVPGMQIDLASSRDRK